MNLEIIRNLITVGSIILLVVVIFHLMFRTTVSETKRTRTKRWENPSVLARQSHHRKKSRITGTVQMLRPTDQERDPFPSRPLSTRERLSSKAIKRSGAPPLRVLRGHTKTASANR